MSAFQAYAGTYEFRGASFAWRCYATARVYGVRRPQQAPLPPPGAGRKWLSKSPSRHEGELLWLVDAWVDDFSQILVQIDGGAPARARRPASVEDGVLEEAVPA